MKEKIKKIIKENYDRNKMSVPWDGMHDKAVEKIMKIIAESASKTFKRMYGNDAEFIDVTSVLPVAKTMNKAFLKK